MFNSCRHAQAEEAEATATTLSDRLVELEAEVRRENRRNGLMEAELRLWKAQANELQVVQPHDCANEASKVHRT